MRANINTSLGQRSIFGPLYSIIVGGVLAVTGLLLLVWFCWMWMGAHRSASWPTTNGKVLSSKMSAHQVGSGRGGRPDSVRAEISVRYEYTVDSIRYESRRISFSDSVFLQRGVNSTKVLVGKYPAGSTVEVHYDPKAPSSSVLEINLQNKNAYLVLVFGGLLLGGGLWSVIVAIKQRKMVSQTAHH